MKQRFEELRLQASLLPDGKQKLLLLEEAIQIADQYLTKREAYEARMEHTDVACSAGYADRMIVSFAWCLSRFEGSPGEYSQSELLWKYKWVLNQIWHLPQLDVGRIDAVFDDFKAKYLQYGYSLRPYYRNRVVLLQSLGRMEEAEREYKLWREAPRDSMSDCRACEQNDFGYFYFRMGEPEEGIKALKPILAGKMTCHAVPENTYGQLILPLAVLGRADEALRYARLAHDNIGEGPYYLYEYGVLLEFYTAADIRQAAKIYERSIRHGLECKMPWDRFHYFLAVRQFLQEWERRPGKRQLLGTEHVTLEWLDREIATIAEAFDARGSNRYMHQLIANKEREMLAVKETFGHE